MKRTNVGIIGFGRFGQLWAKILHPDHNVSVTNRSDKSQLAAELGVTFKNLAKLCAEAEVIFLCVPISQVEATACQIKPYIRPGTAIFDTCSVKVHPAEAMRRCLGDIEGVELVATHPMFGPDSAAKGVAGLPLVIWPLAGAGDTYRDWRAYFEHLGMRIVELSPDEHDQLAARSQGVTHYIGRVLSEMDLQPTPMDTAGFKIICSLIEQTCHDSWELFHDLQNYNPYTKEVRLRLEEALDRVYSMLLPESVSPGELVVGIQGGQGSFNEEACRHYCRLSGVEQYSIRYLYTSENVLGALHRGEIDRGVFAIQNAAGGVVMETIEALSQYSCHILNYFEIVISHCILLHPRAQFEGVNTLISHPQALAQCKATLKQRYPHLNLISGEGNLVDQALCAQHLAAGKLPLSTAVLAPKVCADLHGLTVQAENLQDLGDANLTTFVWVERRHYFR
jgi:prephenate dehydrogenase